MNSTTPLEALLNKVQLRTIVDVSDWYFIAPNSQYLIFHYRQPDGTSMIIRDLPISPEEGDSKSLELAVRMAKNQMDQRPKNIRVYGNLTPLKESYLNLLICRVFRE